MSERKKMTARQEAWLVLVFMSCLLVWIFKGWKYGVGLFLTIGILNQIRVLIFGRKEK